MRSIKNRTSERSKTNEFSVTHQLVNKKQPEHFHAIMFQFRRYLIVYYLVDKYILCKNEVMKNHYNILRVFTEFSSFAFSFQTKFFNWEIRRRHSFCHFSNSAGFCTMGVMWHYLQHYLNFVTRVTDWTSDVFSKSIWSLLLIAYL